METLVNLNLLVLCVIGYLALERAEKRRKAERRE